MRRMFSALYPYHIASKTKAQKLIDFPLQFYSEKFQIEEKSLILGQSFSDQYSEILEGATYGCGAFLSLLAEQNLKDLEDLIECNMFKALEKSFKSYKDLGYTISSIGSTENSKSEIFDYNIYVGHLLPYRNLNLDKSKYNISTEKNKEPIPNFHAWDLKEDAMNTPDLPELSDLESLDLKEIRALDNDDLYRSQIEKLRNLFAVNSVEICVIDIGYMSSFKLIVRDKEGNIIEGADDENKQEFHSFRMESISYEEGLFKRFFNHKSDLSNFLKQKFPEIFNQFIISDVDGFMNGNPFTKS